MRYAKSRRDLSLILVKMSSPLLDLLVPPLNSSTDGMATYGTVQHSPMRCIVRRLDSKGT